MIGLCRIVLCCCGIVSLCFAGLKEDIKSHFEECQNNKKEELYYHCFNRESNVILNINSSEAYCDGIRYSTTSKQECFIDFYSKYNTILYRQCNNNKKLECLMILDTILAIKKDAITDETNTIVYFLDTQTSKSGFLGLDDALLNRIFSFCRSDECYEVAKKIGLNLEMVKPFLNKACNENVADACYALGK